MASSNYEYRTPETDEGFPSTFSVDTVVPASPLDMVAEEFQAVMYEAWAKQFDGVFTEDEIRKTVDPEDKAKVDAQQDRLSAGGVDKGEPLYVHAWFAVPKVISPGMGRYVAGVGKAVEVKQRLWKPNLADVSNVFVRPTASEFNLQLQGRGIGSAILHTMLDIFAEDMATVVYDFEFNSRAVKWLGSLGFSADKSWAADYFGQTVDLTKFDGPPAGEVVETLEAKRPWLKERVPK